MTGNERVYQQAVSLGHSAAWDQDWEKAAEFYRQALAERPEDPKALNNLALALFELGEYRDALQTYLRLIEKNPNDPVPLERAAILYENLNNLQAGAKLAVRAAEMHLKSGDVEKAIENWTRALTMVPEHLGAHSRLALVYERLKRIPQAVQEYLHIASLMQHLGEREKAIQAINRALKLSPDNEKVHQSLTMLRENMRLPKLNRPQRLEETFPQTAPSHFEKKDDLPESSPIVEAEKKALTTLAGLFFEQNEEGGSAPSPRSGGIQAILSGSESIFSKDVDQTQLMLHLGQAVEYLSLDENEHAAAELERVVDIGLHHPAAYYQLGVLRMKTDRLESAMRYLKRAVTNQEYALASRLLMANLNVKRENYKEASMDYLKALRLADCMVVLPDHANHLHQLYEPLLDSHTRNTSQEKSAQICKTISELLDRAEWRPYLKKVRSELVPDDGGHPRPLAEALTEASSSDIVVSISNIRELVREGRGQAAFEEALFALQDAPNYLPLHITIGELLASANQTQAAIEKFLVVARSYSVRGETARAIEMLERIVEMSPMDMAVRNHLIDQLIANGKSNQAIKELVKLAEVHYSLAELAEARKAYTRSLRYIQQSGADTSWQVRVMHRIADIDVQSLNWRRALSIYQQICAIQYDNIDANRKLIDLNFRLGERNQAITALENFIKILRGEGRHAEILTFLENLAEDWPDQIILKSYLAEFFAQAGRIEDAVLQLDSAGELYMQAGSREGAIRSIQKIIDLNPPNVEKYRQLLAEIQ
jgi:tetratricopeptide (TPR) repeat protein